MDPLVLLIVGAVGLAACVILLLLGLNMLREERASKEGATTQPASASSVVAPIVTDPTSLAASEPAAISPEASKPSGGATMGAALAGVTARFSSGATRGNAHEVLRVLRDNLTGRLMLEISGKRYASLAELRDDEVRQALMTNLQDLDAFSGGVMGTAERPPDAAAGSAVAGPAAIAPATRQVAVARAARPAGEPAPAAPAEYRPLPPPTMNPFKQLAVLREMAKNPPPEPKSITEQIDDVLQERILGTPLIHRSLHVRPGPRGDAVFEADGQNYSSVDEVPDVEVRDAIKAAIAEWESKK